MQHQHTDIQPDQYGYLRCSHRLTAIRQRTRKNGVLVFCEQCLVCGAELRTVGKHSPEVKNLAEAAVFDDNLQTAWSDRLFAHRELHQRRMESDRAAADAAWWQQYNEYINSPAWKKKRAIKLDRTPAGLCEGCGVNLAVHVHHLTYEHLGNELLWELRAVCRSCHQRIHPTRDIQHD